MADTTALASLRTKRLCEGKILPLGVSGSQRKIYREQRGLCNRNIKRKKTLESRKIYLYEHIGYNFSQWSIIEAVTSQKRVYHTRKCQGRGLLGG